MTACPKVLPSDVFKLPALQPADLVSVHGFSATDTLVHVHAILTALDMECHHYPGAWKISVAAFSHLSGYARMTVRIWRRDTPEQLAIDVARDRGDRMVRLKLQAALRKAFEIRGEVDIGGSVQAFASFGEEFSTRRLPLFNEPRSVDDDVDVDEDRVVSASLLGFIDTEYDDVALEGCCSLASLVRVQEDHPCWSWATMSSLLQGLGKVVNAHANYSMDTKTMAMVVLLALVQLASNDVTRRRADAALIVDKIVVDMDTTTKTHEDAMAMACYTRLWAKVQGIIHG